MANLKLVGAVAIKVRPDATGFRREAQRQIDEEMRGKDFEVDLKVDADTRPAKAEAEKAKDEIEKKGLQLRVGVDIASIQRAQKQLDAAVKRSLEEVIVVHVDDQGSIDRAQARLDELKNAPAKVDIDFVPDEKGFRDVIAKLEQIKRDNQITEKVDIDFDDASIDAKIAELQARLTAFAPHAVISLSYNNNRASLEKAIAEIDAALANIDAVKIDVQLDRAQLLAKRAELDAQLGKLPVKLEFDDNLAGLREAKARIEGFLGIGKFHIETTLDEAALRGQLAIVNARIKDEERKDELKIKPKIDIGDYFKTLAAIKFLAKDQVVHFRATLDSTKLLLAAAKLTGLRAASRWTEEFGRAIGTLDRNLPIVAAVTLGISQLSSSILSLTANIFSLGNGLGEVLRSAGLLAPALILGLGASVIVLEAVFKDFGAAVHGIDAALKRLPPAGQEAAKRIRPIFAQIREALSVAFWGRAADAMLRFTNIALPAVGAGLTQLSGSLGGIFAVLLDSFNRFTQNSGVAVFFANLTRGFDVAQTGLADFMDGFNTLAVVGSTAFPRIGRAFNEFAAQFKVWVDQIAADGTLQRWIDIGIQGMKDLGAASVSLVKIWGNVGQAAQAAGALTLHSFAQALDRLDRATAGERFQRNMKTIFQGAAQASEIFIHSLGSLGPAFDVFSVTIKNTLIESAKALGGFIKIVGDVISSPLVNNGMTAFLTGLQAMFESLRPAAGAIAQILGTVGQVLGQVARDSGPLFRDLFGQLATVITAAWSALQPFLPALVELGTTVVNIVGPALSKVALAAIPAFVDAVLTIGNALRPAIQFFSDFAVGATIMLNSIPLPIILGIATSVLTLGGAFRLVSVVGPLATAAMQLFGVEAGIAAARTALLVPVIGIGLALALGAATAALGTFAGAQGSAAPFANEFEDSLRRDAEAAKTFVGVIGDATKATALNKLANLGAFEAAKNLGLSTDDVTDALFGNTTAADKARAAISKARKAYDDAVAAQNKVGANGFLSPPGLGPDVPDSLKAGARDADILDKALQQTSESLDLQIFRMKELDKANKHAGITTDGVVDSQQGLATQAGKTSSALAAAAAASTTLQDTFSSSAAKIDAMRKTFALLVGPNAKQETAAALGAYASGFWNLLDSVKPIQKELQALGDNVFGDDGFLNIKSGNKAVLQLNQALVDEVNNIWVGAKQAYDAAIQQGKTVEEAFKISKDFIDQHHGDYNQLAEASGVASKKVQGQWEAIFGHEWVLKVSLSGLTAVAATAQSMLASIGAQFDGAELTAYFDANPDKALKAASDVTGAAKDFVNHHWQAKFDALPDAAQDKITALLNRTNKEWVEGDFQSILSVAKDIPGFAEALLKINNGVKDPFIANFFASLNLGSLGYVQARLDEIANKTRYAHFQVTIDDLQRDQALANRGRNGGIVNGAGRGLAGFGMEPIKFFASGGIENHVAQITRPNGPLRVWSERETLGEAYIPMSSAKRQRSVQILGEVARRFGYDLNKAQRYAGGGIAGNTTHTTSADVHIGSITTVDMDQAVASLRQSQRDSLAVAGISSIGV